MLRSRLIPCLLIHNGGLYKTVKFQSPKYVGDPVNAVRIFNEKAVDELMILDIDATPNGREPDYHLIENIAGECRMPLCYGGGITSVRQAKRIVGLGVEKVALSSAAVSCPELLGEIAGAIGRQSVVGVLDVKRNIFGTYCVHSHSGNFRTNCDPASLARLYQTRGAGEIVVNSIDNDGTMAGYDLRLSQLIRDAVDIPITILGGAGSNDHVKLLVSTLGVVGAAAGSLFVFKGKYRAVLISYPGHHDRCNILGCNTSSRRLGAA